MTTQPSGWPREGARPTIVVYVWPVTRPTPEAVRDGIAAPVVRVDGRPVGDGRPGPITRRLVDAFRRATRG